MSEYSIQRFRGGYAIVYTGDDGKRVRRRLYATDRPGAEAEARQGWGRSDNTPWAVGRIVTAYIADREAEGIASTSRQRDAWKAMRGYWERVHPSLIDTKMAQAYAGQRRAAAATIRYELSMLSVALRWAAKPERGHIDRAPDVWRPEPPERKVRHLTVRQFERWFAGVKAPHARLYVELGIATMARPTAILQLTWGQVDWERGEIDLNPPGRRQTRKRRPIVALSDNTMELLRQAYEARQIDHIIERGGKPIASMKKAFQAASERTGVHVTPYTLRHTGAVWAAEEGVSMPEIAQFLGHDSDVTTQKYYSRFSPGYLRKVSDAVQNRRHAN